MATEIERKYLVIGDAWKALGKGTYYRQGYLSSATGRTVRVRIGGDRAFLTVKGPSHGISRAEFEYPIPLEDAAAMLETLCEVPAIEKTRYVIPAGAFIWEVDEFHGENRGLVVAEVELKSESDEPTLPEWIGEEVSSDRRYCNSNLVKRPFTTW